MSDFTVRRETWTSAVFEAISAFRKVLSASDANPKDVLAAGGEIFRLEMTRMRHGGTLTGTADTDFMKPLQPIIPLPPMSADLDESDEEEPDFTAEIVADRSERIRELIQNMLDSRKA